MKVASLRNLPAFAKKSSSGMLKNDWPAHGAIPPLRNQTGLAVLQMDTNEDV